VDHNSNKKGRKICRKPQQQQQQQQQQQVDVVCPWEICCGSKKVKIEKNLKSLDFKTPLNKKYFFLKI